MLACAFIASCLKTQQDLGNYDEDFDFEIFNLPKLSIRYFALRRN